MARIILASGSPRRQELLRRIGLREFEISVPDVEEWYPPELAPEDIVAYISRDVYFREVSRQELLAYIRGGEPMDKAGAYGVQGQGALLVERIDGDFFNVMGLPVVLLSRMLAEFGVTLLA